ncbi:MAG: HTH-type transcriptional regulator PgrR [Herbaspirillum frisingense]|uniref:HTH-type transcriptional regulator PgrR n=1 Tax=Herbaspirillum frisingense TaxID=92645 RepID=A0A7V8FVX5_9BURK|nr:MAG: HTH-type transcriptional regulator PgrR [Herbaspirillum frisingense]
MKTPKPPSFSDLNAFIAVAAHRSFRRAADVLGMSHSALSHAMRGLESGLGVRLLNRTTRSVSLTPEGERLLARLTPVLGELNAVLGEAAAAAGQPAGVVRINGSEGAIRLLLDTVVPRFHARYPNVELDLVAEGKLVDIVEGGFDAGVRLGEAVPKDMVAVRLGADFRFLPVAAPAYLATAPTLKLPEDLRDHRCIRQRLPSGKRYRWEFRKKKQELAIDVPGALTLDNNQLMCEAAAQGHGSPTCRNSTPRLSWKAGACGPCWKTGALTCRACSSTSPATATCRRDCAP